MAKKMIISKSDTTKNEIDPKKIPWRQNSEGLKRASFKEVDLLDSGKYIEKNLYPHKIQTGQMLYGKNVTDDKGGAVYRPEEDPVNASELKRKLDPKDKELLNKSPYNRKIDVNENFKDSPDYLGYKILKRNHSTGTKEVVPNYDKQEYVLRREIDRSPVKEEIVKEEPVSLPAVKEKSKSKGISLSMSRGTGPSKDGGGQNYKKMTLGVGNRTFSIKFKTPTHGGNRIAGKR